jgi:hypothetical protein
VDQFVNLGMLAAEQIKYQKHEAQYACPGSSFVAFVCSSFGAFGPFAIRFILVFSYAGAQAHDALQNKQGLDPLIDSKQAQYSANCYRFKLSTAQEADAMAKATVMCLSGTLSLPVLPPVPC